MTHSIENTSIDNQISLLLQTEKDEIKKGRQVDHLIDIKETNGEDPIGSQTKKSTNQIFDEMFEDLDNSSVKLGTIFKVNAWLRKSNHDAYTPKMVSIGPYHKKDPQLRRMEKYKILYLQRFLQRKEGLDVESCINKLEELKEEAMKCYEDVEDLDTDEFCRMLLLDGCFVIEFIRERSEICPEGEDNIMLDNDGGYVFGDLMLLENQLPFFVLNKLHQMTMQDNESPLAILVNKSFPFLVVRPTMTPDFFTGRNMKHLLHVVHMISCHGNPIEKPNCHQSWHKPMPNATELSEAGVSFAKASDSTSLFDIKFENGLMTIPHFKVEDSVESLLRNLIAYEQQSRDEYPTYFSDFAFFMDTLIDSDKDVNLLRQKGIIVNFIGEDKEVASLFNKIGSGITMYSDFYYKEEFRKTVKHCEKRWNRMKANLRHNYFSSPWVGASTIAAIILLILTTIQTILAFTGSVM